MKNLSLYVEYTSLTTKSIGDIVYHPTKRQLAIVNELTIDDPNPSYVVHLHLFENALIKKGDFIHNRFFEIMGVAGFDEEKIDPHLDKLYATTNPNLNGYKIDKDFKRVYVRSFMEHLDIPESFDMDELTGELNFIKKTSDISKEIHYWGNILIPLPKTIQDRFVDMACKAYEMFYSNYDTPFRDICVKLSKNITINE